MVLNQVHPYYIYKVIKTLFSFLLFFSVCISNKYYLYITERERKKERKKERKNETNTETHFKDNAGINGISLDGEGLKNPVTLPNNSSTTSVAPPKSISANCKAR